MFSRLAIQKVSSGVTRFYRISYDGECTFYAEEHIIHDKESSQKISQN